MSKLFIFILLFFLSSSCSSLKNTRRSDFVSGCFIGVQSSAPISLTEAHLERIIDYCLYTYDSKKEKLENLLDDMHEDIEKIPPKQKLDINIEENESEDDDEIRYI